MKKVIFFAWTALSSIFLLSCGSETKPTEVKIIEEIGDGSFKSRASDSVNDLYEELLKEDKDLNDFENSITTVLEKRHAVETPFLSFDAKNQTYYSSAQDHLNSIRDSVLKQKYRELILKSLAHYGHKTNEVKKIIESNKSKVLRIEDLRVVLKLATTLAFIEKYQDKAKPDKKSLLDINNELSHKAAEIQKKIAR